MTRDDTPYKAKSQVGCFVLDDDALPVTDLSNEITTLICEADSVRYAHNTLASYKPGDKLFWAEAKGPKNTPEENEAARWSMLEALRDGQAQRPPCGWPVSPRTAAAETKIRSGCVGADRSTRHAFFLSRRALAFVPCRRPTDAPRHPTNGPPCRGPNWSRQHLTRPANARKTPSSSGSPFSSAAVSALTRT